MLSAMVLKKHWSCLAKLGTDVSFKKKHYMFDCAETPYTISLNSSDYVESLLLQVIEWNSGYFNTRCGNGINLTRQSISWCSWRPKHCQRASLALMVGSHTIREQESESQWAQAAILVKAGGGLHLTLAWEVFIFSENKFFIKLT